MVTIASGTPFVWDSADFTWDSANGGKSWDTAATALYALAPSETVGILPLELRAPHIPISETSHLGEQTARRILPQYRVLLSARETLAPRTDYRRTAAETAAVTEQSARQTARTARSTLAFADTYLLPWQGILSNITLFTGGLTDEAWARASVSPSGYEAFHPFEVGEYTYQDALIRLLLTTGAAGADPLLYDVCFHTDIEDTRESGLADCTADGPTRITLTRHYYHPPRIVLTVCSSAAESGIPMPRLISQSDDDGVRTFDCELRLSDGTRTSGTISWMAEGY